MLLRRSSRLLPDYRVKSCHSALVPGAGIVGVMSEHNRARFCNLMKCDSVWVCPVCSMKIATQRANDLKDAINRHIAMGGRVVMATHTIRHNRLDKLATSLETLKQSYRSYLSGRASKERLARFKQVGAVSATEITHSFKNGWHPHLHVLMFFQDYDPSETADLESVLKLAWVKSTQKHGNNTTMDIGLVLRDSSLYAHEYLTKFGRLPSDATWGVVQELTSGHSKTARSASGLTPWGILQKADELDKRNVYNNLWREYAGATKGRNQLVMSKGLREYLGLDTETAGAGDYQKDDPSQWWASIEHDLWRKINREPAAKGILIGIASRQDATAWENYLSYIDDKY